MTAYGRIWVTPEDTMVGEPWGRPRRGNCGIVQTPRSERLIHNRSGLFAARRNVVQAHRIPGRLLPTNCISFQISGLPVIPASDGKTARRENTANLMRNPRFISGKEVDCLTPIMRWESVGHVPNVSNRKSN